MGPNQAAPENSAFATAPRAAISISFLTRYARRSITTNANWVHITGLEPNTKYYYEAVGDPGSPREKSWGGDFRTLPDNNTFRHATQNPKGLFNYSFEYACGNNQPNNPGAAGFRTMLREIEDKVNFAILNGDWIYEEKRDYTPEAWRDQVAAAQVPRIVDLAPTIVGVWKTTSCISRAG